MNYKNVCYRYGVLILMSLLAPVTMKFVYHYPPRLIIIDFDCLVWPFWIRCPELAKPLQKTKDGQVIDAKGIRIKPYDEVPSLLSYLEMSKYNLALVGRMGHELLDLFDWKSYFRFVLLEPGPKINHVTKLRKRTGVIYQEMLYFGFNPNETKTVKQTLNIVSVIVKRGMTKADFYYGTLKYMMKITA